jgi:hypothetical protein
MGIDPLQLAELAGAGQFAGEGKVRQIAALGADLKHAAGPAHRVAEDQALLDVLGAGLLAIHVFAGLGGVHRHRGVPIGAGGDQHGIDIGPV